MRITGIRIDGFGVWNGLELTSLDDDLTVFYGPNEAGKTTLVQFVRSIFYGFSPERRAQYLPPVRGGRAGGTIEVASAAKTYTVTRRADDPAESSTAFITQNGHELNDPATLPALLGGVDESIFNNVFVFGLKEIQELGTLTDTEAADELYNLALGLDRVSLVDVLSELESSRNRLLASDDRPSLVAQLLGQRERLQSEIDALGSQTHRYLSLSAQREKLSADIARLTATGTQLDEQARELALARALTDRWQRRSAIDERLKGLAGFSALPGDALSRFDRIEARLRAPRARLAKLKEERRELRNQIYQLSINEGLCRQAMRFEALAEQQQWIAAIETQIGELETQIAGLDTERQESVRRFNIARQPGGTLEPISRHGMDALRSAASALRQARRDIRQLESKNATATETASSYLRRLETALGLAKDNGLTHALTEAGELVSRLRQRVQLDERLDQMSRRERQLGEQSDEQLDRQMLPGWVLAALGSIFVLGSALVLLFVAGLILPASLSAALGWPVGAFGLVAVGTATGLKFGLEGRAARQLDSSHAQLDSLSQQIQQAKEERDALDEQLPSGGGPLVARLQAAEKELARLEELMPLDAEREAAERDAQSVSEQTNKRRDDLKRQRQSWTRLLAENGLPAELAPAELREYCNRRTQIRGMDQSLTDKREELARLRGQYEGIARRISQAVADAGIVPQATRPLEQLRQCLSELTQEQARSKRRDELGRQIDRLGRRYSKWSQSIDRLRHRRQLLLQAAGTSDEQEFRRRAAAQAEAEDLAAQRASLAREISAALGGQSSEDKLARWISDAAGMAAAETHLAEARKTTNDQLAQSHQTLGEISQQLKMLVEDRQLGQKRIELGVVEKRLTDALDRWRVLTICGLMLQGVRDYYEREHQPQALREASGYLERLTMGRYVRVWTPLGDHSLRVDDAQGNSLGVDVLSRGTREQLFLALRMALVSAYARKGSRIPLVLDDVLVNFDVARAKAAAVVLREFARNDHQVLVFTCHEHISKLFKNVKADVRQLPDNSQPQLSEPPAPPSRRARRPRPAVALEPEPAEEPELEPVFEEAELPMAQVVAAAPTPLAAITLPQLTAPPSPLELPPAPPPVRVESPPVPPRPRPEPAPRKTVRRMHRVDWSAEEFEGELQDRVRRDVALPDQDSAEPRAKGDGDDAEAA